MSRSPDLERPDESRSTEVAEPRPVPDVRTASVPIDRLTLRPGHERQPVRHRGRTYRLRDSDVQALATVGTFRVVRADDVQAVRSSRDAWRGELRHLREEGLVDIKTVTINRESTAVAVLTHDGKSLLEAHQVRSPGRPVQAFHAGLVKPRELAHDAQLLRLYQAEAARIEADGGRVERVLLDYELKRDYQMFLNRPNRETTADDDVAAFAEAHGLPIIDGHLELPDLRIDYETPDGTLQHRDVELVTEHYSRAQLAGKSQAGFSMYRAAGARRGGGSARTGGTPIDPHHLEWLP
jgi:hypothetical protein